MKNLKVFVNILSPFVFSFSQMPSNTYVNGVSMKAVVNKIPIVLISGCMKNIAANYNLPVVFIRHFMNNSFVYFISTVSISVRF
jgi:hypothetical protein